MKKYFMTGIELFREKYKDAFTVKDYLNEVKRTYEPEFWNWGLDDIKVNILDKIHCIMGVVDEMSEFDIAYSECLGKDSEVKELSDIFWYLANYCNFTKLEFIPANSDQMSYNFQFEALLGIHKKELAYGKIPEHDQLKDYVQTGIEYLYGCCKNLNVTPEDVMKINLEKLYLRYPEKFSSDLAINKDESKECVIIDSTPGMYGTTI